MIYVFDLNSEPDLNLAHALDGTLVSKHQESAFNIIRIVGVYAMIFLNARPIAPDVGSLILSLENGMIQVWTHHPAAGFLTSFSAVHGLNDYAMSLATDPKNKYLITGLTLIHLYNSINVFSFSCFPGNRIVLIKLSQVTRVAT